MPTGYTAGVQDGTITSLREYAILCARAFGACIMLRDDPLSSEIPQFTIDDHYVSSLEEAQIELLKWEGMPEDQRRQLYERETETTRKDTEERREQHRIQMERYHTMLQQAKAFTPPTKDHEKHKEFMVQQLEESIKWDGSFYEPTIEPYEQWKITKSSTLLQRIEWAARHLNEERKRTVERNAWVSALREALQ